MKQARVKACQSNEKETSMARDFTEQLPSRSFILAYAL